MRVRCARAAQADVQRATKEREQQRQAAEEQRRAREAAERAAQAREKFEDAERTVAQASAAAAEAIAVEDRLEAEVRDLEEAVSPRRGKTWPLPDAARVTRRLPSAGLARPWIACRATKPARD